MRTAIIVVVVVVVVQQLMRCSLILASGCEGRDAWELAQLAVYTLLPHSMLSSGIRLTKCVCRHFSPDENALLHSCRKGGRKEKWMIRGEYHLLQPIRPALKRDEKRLLFWSEIPCGVRAYRPTCVGIWSCGNDLWGRFALPSLRFWPYILKVRRWSLHSYMEIFTDPANLTFSLLCG